MVLLLVVGIVFLWKSSSCPGEAETELFLIDYHRIAYNYDSDVEFNRPGGTILTLSTVS